MAQSQVNVVFGAQVQGLLTGIAQAVAAVESMRGPVDAVQAALVEFGEVAGIAYATEKIREFATEMAELGEQTLNSAYLLGQSVGDYAQLSGAFTLVGGDAETAQRTIERLALSVQRVAEGNKTAIAAFHNLGISTAEVNSHSRDLNGLLELIIRRYGELEPSVRNVGVAHELLGRGVDRLAGLLRHGAEGWKEIMVATQEYRAATERAAEAEDQSAEKINKLRLDVLTLSHDGFMVLKPLVDSVVGAMDGLVRALDWVASAFTTVDNAISRAIAHFDQFLGIATEAEKRFLSRQGEMVEGYAYADIPPRVGTRPLGTEGPARGRGGAGSDERMQQWRDELRHRLEAEQNFFGDSRAEELKFWQDKYAIVGTGSKNDLKLREEIFAQIFELEKGIAREAERSSLDELTFHQQFAKEDLSLWKAHSEQRRELGLSTAREALQAELDELDQHIANIHRFYEEKLRITEVDAQKHEQILHQELLEEMRLNVQRLELETKLLTTRSEMEQRFGQLFDQIGQKMEATISGLITRQETWRSAAKKLFDGILQDFTKMVGEMIAEWAKIQLLKMVPGAAGATTIGGALFHLLPFAERGWVVPSFQQGGILSMVHANEMVLPADISQGLQAAIRGGGLGGGSTINIQAWDHRDVARWVRANPHVFAAGVNHASRMGYAPRTQ